MDKPIGIAIGSLGVSKTFVGESRVEGSVRVTHSAPVGEHFLLMVVGCKKFAEPPPTYNEISPVFNSIGWYDEETLCKYFGKAKMQKYVEQLPVLRRGDAEDKG